MTAADDLLARLPSYRRDADAELGGPLLAYLSLPGRQQDAIRTLRDRLDRRLADPHAVIPSALADPETADNGWLDWQAQAVGVDLRHLEGETARRDALRYAPTGRRRATKAAIAGAARSALIGTRYVRVFDHSVSQPGDSTVWDMLLVTRSSETPDVPAVLAAVAAKRAKPVGVRLHHRPYSASLNETRAALTADTLNARKAMFPTLQSASDYLPEA